MNTLFFKSITLAGALALPLTGLADHNTKEPDHHSMPGMPHSSQVQGDKHEHEHQHDANEHEGHDHGAMNMGSTITQTDKVVAAIAAGGAPVVVDVLGVVCDFCATAMNKTFGKRAEVAAVYVDLDKKTLSLVIGEGEALSDEQIEELVKKAGYRIANIRRDGEALGG